MRAVSDQSETRLRCVQCSVVFKEAKRLNRHRREVCSVGERLHCDYAGCSITFKASRHKAAHIKKQHREGIARSLSPAEQSGPGFQEEDMPDFTMTTPPEPGQTHQEYHIPMIDTSHTPRVLPSLMVEEHPSALSASNTRESPPTLYDGLGNLRAEVTNNRMSQIAHTQAIFTSIWDRDVDALSAYTDMLEIDPRNATLADGTPLADFALENDQDEIAVLLLERWLLVGPPPVTWESFNYHHKVMGSATSGGDAKVKVLAVLRRLKSAAEAMKDEAMEDEAEGRWWLYDFIDKIRWAEAMIRKGIDGDHGLIDVCLGIKIPQLL